MLNRGVFGRNDYQRIGALTDGTSKYASPATSGLSVTIPDEGASDIKIELSRK